jgi:hypothetical protein
MVELWYPSLCCLECVMQDAVYFHIGVLIHHFFSFFFFWGGRGWEFGESCHIRLIKFILYFS